MLRPALIYKPDRVGLEAISACSESGLCLSNSAYVFATPLLDNNNFSRFSLHNLRFLAYWGVVDYSAPNSDHGMVELYIPRLIFHQQKQ